MKHFFSLCMMFICLSATAQTTELIVDCQNPGWLSSLITYPQQQNTEYLTVNGFINKTDITFINNMITNGRVKVVNLLDATIIENNGAIAEYFPKSGFIEFDRSSLNPLNKYILPKHINTVIDPNISSKIDTVSLANKFLRSVFRPQTSVKYWELLEGVEEIAEKAFLASFSTTTICSLPNSLIKIHRNAFFGGTTLSSDVKLPPNIICVGDSSSGWYDKTFSFTEKSMYLPSKMRIFNSENNSKTYTTLNCDTLIIPETMEVLRVNINAKVAIQKNPKPPVAPSYGTYNIDKMYVPKGSLSAYKTAYKRQLDKNQIKTIYEIDDIERITINPTNISCYVGENGSINASIYPIDAFDKTLTWSSSDNTIINVDQHGNFNAINPGIATISVKANNGVEAICNINVLQHVNGISIEPQNIKITKLGSSESLTAIITPSDASNKNVEWTSSNPAICHVTNDGTITALDYGLAIITATTDDGNYSSYCMVEIKDEESSIIEINNDITKVYTNNSNIIIENAPIGSLVRITMINGHDIFHSVVDSEIISFNPINRGIFIVTVGHLTYKLVL